MKKDRQTYKFKNVFASKTLKENLTDKDLKFCKKLLKLKECNIGFITPRENICSFTYKDLQVNIVNAYSLVLVVGDESGMNGTNVFPLTKNIQLFVANDSIFAIKQEELSATPLNKRINVNKINTIKILDQPIPYHNGKDYEIINNSFNKSKYIFEISEEEWPKIVDFYKFVNITPNNNKHNNSELTNLDIKDKLNIFYTFFKSTQNTNELNKNNNSNKKTSLKNTEKDTQILNSNRKDENIMTF
ncbi:MAG: hypothetical protein ACI4R8_05220 [Candidatus Caccovivens sp.]